MTTSGSGSGERNGVILVDKAKGPTSHDVVREVRRITGQRRCGHTGTLDPLATGLLPVCIGRATRLARFLSGAVKTYRAVIRFGFATDTYDADGKRVGEAIDVEVDPEVLESALKRFVGEQQQIPPPFAAKKIGGERMYRLARAGVSVEPRAVTVVIRRIDLVSVAGSSAGIDLEVESGTYVRSLAHDLGRALGVGAHLKELRRTSVGPLSVEDAATLEELAETWEEEMLAPERALGHFPALHLSEEEAARIVNGRPVVPGGGGRTPAALAAGCACRLFGPRGEFLGMGVAGGAGEPVRPSVIFVSPEGLRSQTYAGSGFTP